VKIHSVIGIITNSSSELYTASLLFSDRHVFRNLLDSLWALWVVENYEEFEIWYRYDKPGCTGLSKIPDSDKTRFPLSISESNEGLCFYISMTGNDLPIGFTSYLVSVIGGERTYQ
jgi:hypothetical protein